jgi:hypothetical protein
MENDEAMMDAAREHVAKEMEQARESLRKMDVEAEKLTYLYERLVRGGIRVLPGPMGQLMVGMEDLRGRIRSASDHLKKVCRSFETIPRK